MVAASSGLSMAQKVLLALYRLSHDARKKVRYEDIVVQAFKDYPNDFHLKGYPQYPDSGDTIHKPLYDYRKKGMVAASNKMFALTTQGVAEAQKLLAVEKGRPLPPAHHRLERSAQIEVERIKRLEGFKLFLEGKREQIIDSDLFEYLGVSVRTSRNDFIGRLETTKSTVEAAADAAGNDPLLHAVCQFHDFMMTRFAQEITFKTSGGGR